MTDRLFRHTFESEVSAGCRIRQPFLRESIIFTGQFKIEADAGLLEIRLDPQKSDETGADAEEQPAEETAM